MYGLENCVELRPYNRSLVLSEIDSEQSPLESAASILLVDSDNFYVKLYKERLRRVGFSHVVSSEHLSLEAWNQDEKPDIILIDLNQVTNFDCFLMTKALAKYRGFTGPWIFMGKEFSFDELYQIAILGISDFWVKSPFLDIATEIRIALRRQFPSKRECFNPKRLLDLGFFRSTGLTKMEMSFISELASGFPRQCEIASRIGRTPTYVHKIFSRIYEKLSIALPIDNPTQLAHLLTICSLFN